MSFRKFASPFPKPSNCLSIQLKANKKRFTEIMK